MFEGKQTLETYGRTGIGCEEEELH